jgi:mannose-6-phosphate isomerase-like protein (cupin superfamily)
MTAGRRKHMIKTAGQQTVRVGENLRGGEGSVTFHEFLAASEAFGTGRLFSRSVLVPGSSIGAHAHEGEFEVYYVLSGVAEIVDDGRTHHLQAGDMHLCPSGHTHSLKNNTADDLEVLMLILYENPAHR